MKSIDYYNKALDSRTKIYDYTKERSDEICIAETLVNYGATLLNIHQVAGQSVKGTIPSPVPCAQQALAIYVKYKDIGGVDEQLRYHIALQLYASSMYLLNTFSEYGETRNRALSMLQRNMVAVSSCVFSVIGYMMIQHLFRSGKNGSLTF